MRTWGVIKTQLIYVTTDLAERHPITGMFDPIKTARFLVAIGSLALSHALLAAEGVPRTTRRVLWQP